MHHKIPGTMVEHRRVFVQRHSQLILAVILILHVLLALPIIVQPTWTVHESDFFNVGRTLVHEGRLPTAADFPDEPGVMLQSAQPPLYYNLIAPILLLFDSNQTVPPPPQPPVICFGWEQINPIYRQTNDAAWYGGDWPNPALARGLLRLLNVLMLSGAVVLVYAAARLIAPTRYEVALLAAALLAFEPSTLNYMIIIGNDALLLLISAAYTFAAVRLFTADRLQPGALILLGVMTVLAVLTRLNGWALVPITGIVGFLLLRSHLWRRLSHQIRRGIWIGVGVIVVCLVSIVVINYLNTGSLFGRYHELDAVLLASLPGLSAPGSVVRVLIAIARDTGAGSYLVPLDIIGHPHLIAAFGWFTLITLIVAAVGVGLNRVPTRRTPRLILAAMVAAAALLVFARNAAALNVITAQSSTMISAPLRYYSPGLPAAVILIALGLMQIRFATWLGAALMVSWLVISGLNSANLPIYTQPAPMIADEMTALNSLGRAPNLADSYPQIVGYQSAVDHQQSWLDLTLVTHSTHHLSENYAAKLEFTAPGGQPLGCQFPLAQGLYPTELWTPNQSVTTEAHIPSCMADLPAQTQISLRWIAHGAESPPISLGQLSEPLPRASTCPPLLGVIDNKLLVTQYTAPLTAQAGTLYLPAVNWYVLGASSALLRTYTLSAIDGTAEYTCESEPRLGTYAFAYWRSGETVYFDECSLHLPVDAKPGKYVVSLAAKDDRGSWLRVADASGQVLTPARLPVATIDVLPPG